MSSKVKTRPLTTKQKIFVKHIIDNPKQSATKAALAAYNITEAGSTARTIAAQNLAKPSIVSALAAHNQLIENTLINTVNDYKESEKIPERSLAVDTAKYIHDKIHGKATQRVEQTTTGVTLTIDLTSALTGVEPEQLTDK